MSARTADLCGTQAACPVGFQEGKPGRSWVKTQNVRILKVLSLDPPVCLKSNKTLSHCVGLATDCWRNLTIGQYQGPGTFTVQHPSLSLLETSGTFSETRLVAFSNTKKKKKGNWTWERKGYNVTIQSKLWFLIVPEFYSTLTGTDLKLLHEENMSSWELFHLIQS